MPHFEEPAPAYPSSPIADDYQRPDMRKSFFGSVKDKLSRKSTPSSQKSKHIAESNMPFSNNPFAHHPVVKQANLPNQPPPAYTVTAPPQSGADYLTALDGPVRSPSPAPSNADSIMSAAGMRVSTPEDPYAFLSSFDTIFIVDDSGSMAGRSWPEVQNVLRAITPICTSHDDDGVDLYFLNNKTTDSGNARAGKAAGGYYGIRRTETVHEIFTTVRPRGATPTGQRLHAILRSYLQLLESKKHDLESVKPINIIVITDGAPSDDVESTIISAAKKLDKLDAPMHQVGVQFFQVGNEPGAREALRELDDDLVGRIDGDLRDMVDTVTWENGNRGVLTADSILKVVLGAVVRRLDRRRTSGEGRR
ncbi:uncharacterized protein ColSpa_10073 [Colletotrichum spaethianum]|uniref:VWFA domain-containing protein n=1 Tax=Colletotrichum spaethianum TaxID=700344 RepID=A0AA37UR17_9PEZI|nr:uncharacterized protein ColSpa_10073 [Colletotrichum spaethianum]GKT49892.1 hypothetical protein ColSpa_10073 [Colletotrichum spaethianum]